jgi:hypothetical protein
MSRRECIWAFEALTGIVRTLFEIIDVIIVRVVIVRLMGMGKPGTVVEERREIH